jgi:hypothetical protein
VGEPSIIDPVGMPDLFATEVSKIERVGKAWRFTLTVRRGNERVVVAKVVLPNAATRKAMLDYLSATGEK